MAVLLLRQMCRMSLTSAGGHQWVEARCILSASSRKAFEGLFSCTGGNAGDRGQESQVSGVTGPPLCHSLLLHIMTLYNIYETIFIILKRPATSKGEIKKIRHKLNILRCAFREEKHPVKCIH